MDSHQQFTSTVSSDQAEERVDEMVSKSLMRNGARSHNSKKAYEEIDRKLAKANRKSKQRKNRFDEESDLEDFYDK